MASIYQVVAFIGCFIHEIAQTESLRYVQLPTILKYVKSFKATQSQSPIAISDQSISDSIVSNQAITYDHNQVQVGNYLYLRQNETHSYIIQNNTIEENYINSIPNFDYSTTITYTSSSAYSTVENNLLIRNQLASLLPKDYPKPIELLNDMKHQIDLMNHINPIHLDNGINNFIHHLLNSFQSTTNINANSVGTPRDFRNCTLTCRLQLLDSVRCPKWHMDYVSLRLVKTYYGLGTEFVDPLNMKIRVLNYLYRNFPTLYHSILSPSLSDFSTQVNNNIIDDDVDMGLQVFSSSNSSSSSSSHNNNENKDDTIIQPTQCGDVLIMSGRNRHHTIPILHRSPPMKSTTIEDTTNTHAHTVDASDTPCTCANSTSFSKISHRSSNKRLLFSVTIK